MRENHSEELLCYSVKRLNAPALIACTVLIWKTEGFCAPKRAAERLMTAADALNMTPVNGSRQRQKPLTFPDMIRKTILCKENSCEANASQLFLLYHCKEVVL